MAFDLKAEFEKHKVLFIGGGLGLFILFYLFLSSGGSSASSSQGSSSDFDAELQADEQAAQVQAAEQVQQSQDNTQLQEAQIAANAQTSQTSAALEANDENTAASLAATIYGDQAGVAENTTDANATTEQEYNQLIETQNTTSMQDAVLADQINSGVTENANNNATALAGLENTNAANVSEYDTGVNAATTVEQEEVGNEYQEAEQIIPLAGQQKNSLTDATDQTSLFADILSGGSNPTAVTTASTAVATSGAGKGLLQSIFG